LRLYSNLNAASESNTEINQSLSLVQYNLICIVTRIINFIVERGNLIFQHYNFILGALEYWIKRYWGTHENGQEIDVSRFFIYYVALMMEEEKIGPHKDSGSYIPDAVYGLVKYGLCLEEIWPHEATDELEQPPWEVFEQARNLKVVPLLVPPHLESMKRCLNDDLPFVIAMNVELFNEPDMRALNRLENEPPQEFGWHAVLVIGYDDRTQRFLVRNSWGKEWVSFLLN
jgi:hypothetical protein